MGVKWLGRETNHSPPSSVKVKNEWSYTTTTSICLHGMQRDTFNLFYLNVDSTNNNDTQTWEKSNGRFILLTNQLTTDNFKSTRKAHTQKNR